MTDPAVRLQPLDPSDRWLDISRPLAPGIPVWPGDRPFELEQKRANGMVLSAISTTCHVGTHVDADLHMEGAGAAVESIPLERLVGPAEVVRATGRPRRVGFEHLPAGWTPAAPRILVRTDSHPADARTVGAGLSGLAVELVHGLADRGVVLVGIDSPSVDPFDSTDPESHHALALRTMTWIEGLLLEAVEPGLYDLVALPMPLVGAEASPVRAILRPRSC
ncbi:MAG: cyclase family protein [Acidobacteria bacterium]|jgi:arylformamidase|nr:cyclase family protein [Acidobacteriota bacterium]